MNITTIFTSKACHFTSAKTTNNFDLRLFSTERWNDVSKLYQASNTITTKDVLAYHTPKYHNSDSVQEAINSLNTPRMLSYYLLESNNETKAI